jgi:geranylgeranyl pyrophosphate synthase
MDDDDLRRGRPTTHVAFDVATATRAGWMMVPVAGRVLVEGAKSLGLSPRVLKEMSRELFQASGPEGMVGGQWLDLEAERRELDLAGLVQVHRGKTGALIRASCGLGALAAEAPAEQVEALRQYGADIGLAFQVADDVLDVTGTSEDLGKTAGKDVATAKSTYVRLLGVEGARTEAQRLAQAALDHLTKAVAPIAQRPVQVAPSHSPAASGAKPEDLPTQIALNQDALQPLDRAAKRTLQTGRESHSAMQVWQAIDQALDLVKALTQAR